MQFLPYFKCTMLNGILIIVMPFWSRVFTSQNLSLSFLVILCFCQSFCTPTALPSSPLHMFKYSTWCLYDLIFPHNIEVLWWWQTPSHYWAFLLWCCCTFRLGTYYRALLLFRNKHKISFSIVRQLSDSVLRALKKETFFKKKWVLPWDRRI